MKRSFIYNIFKMVLTTVEISLICAVGAIALLVGFSFLPSAAKKKIVDLLKIINIVFKTNPAINSEIPAAVSQGLDEFVDVAEEIAKADETATS
jgi:hypothetical protein